MSKPIRPVFAACTAIALVACGGGTTESSSTSSEPYTGTCGLGTAAYALAQGGSASVTSPVFTISGESDRSAFCAQDSGTSITLVTPTITSSATSSSENNSNLYGLSASVLAYGASSTTTSGGTITVSGGTVTSTSDYASGAFATGKGASVTLYKTTISTSGDYAHAVAATQSATVAVTGTSSSPSSLTSTNGEVVVLEGASQMTISNTDLLSTNPNTYHGILIYDNGTGSGAAGLSITGGSYLWTSANSNAAAFYVSNQTATITLTGVSISNSSTSALVKAVAGTTGSKLTFNAVNQALAGNVDADASSTVALSLATSSTLSGAINADGTAASATVTLDSTSTWTLTGNSYVTVLNDTAGVSGTAVTNIVGNGYNVYYKSASNTALGGATYTLGGGGYLIPY